MNEWEQWKLDHTPSPAQKAEKTPVEYSDKTIADYRPQLRALADCTFQPASYDKRFVRDMAGADDGAKLSIKQAEYIDYLYHRYRKQIPHHEKLCKICKGI